MAKEKGQQKWLNFGSYNVNKQSNFFMRNFLWEGNHLCIYTNIIVG